MTAYASLILNFTKLLTRMGELRKTYCYLLTLQGINSPFSMTSHPRLGHLVCFLHSLAYYIGLVQKILVVVER